VDTHELAWAAGFYDGEGSTSAHNGRGIQLYVSQVDVRPLQRFQLAVCGLGALYGPRAPKGKQQQPFHIWCSVKFEHSQAIIAMLWRYLSDPKKEQMARVVTQIKPSLDAAQDRFLNPVCHRGHPLIGNNVYLYQASNGYQQRQCKTCATERTAQRRESLRDSQEATIQQLFGNPN
jgi:hypothetical protein